MSRTKSGIEKVAVNFAMEKNLKHAWEEILNELGMSLSGAVTLFAKQMVRERKLPFTPDATKAEPGMKDCNKDFENFMRYMKLLQKDKED